MARPPALRLANCWRTGIQSLPVLAELSVVQAAWLNRDGIGLARLSAMSVYKEVLGLGQVPCLTRKMVVVHFQTPNRRAFKSAASVTHYRHDGVSFSVSVRAEQWRDAIRRTESSAGRQSRHFDSDNVVYGFEFGSQGSGFAHGSSDRIWIGVGSGIAYERP